MPLSPLMPNRNGKLREFCVPLKIKRIGKDGKKLLGDETIQNYRSMLESAVETEASKCIVVQGEPGAGKTTFALGTLLDWCDAIATSHDSKLKVDIIDRKQKANDSDAKLKPDTCDASLKTDSSDLSFKADTRVANFNVDISDSKTILGNSDVKPKADTCDAKLKAANCIANLNAGLCDNKTFVGIDSDRYQYFVDVDALNQFKFAFYIPLRHVVDIFEVDKMIKKILIDKLYRSEDQRSNALRLIQDLLSHESCLVLFDGLDEWSHSCYIVPETNLGSNCVCIILTRPWRLAELPVSDFDVHSRLKITGITDERLLIKRVLKCLDDKGGPLYENINALFYEIIEKSLDLSSPIILMQLICIWHEKRTLGDSLCGIYASMLEMLLKRTERKGQTVAQNNMQFNCFKNKRFVQKNADLIAALSKLAFRQTFSEARETNILFGFDDVEACLTEDQRKLTLSSGILSEESTYSLCEDTQTFYFLHKTFQEFFAAMFIVTNKSDKTVFQRMKSYYQRFKTFHVLEISQVFVFVCGLDAKVGYDISQWLVDVIFNKGINKGINLYRLSQEKHEAVKPDVKAVRLLHNAMAAGFKEARANNQTDIELSPEHYQFSIVITNSASMECTLLRQPLRIHKLCIICDYNLINEDGLRTVLQESSCSMHMVETYTERWRDERRLSTRKPVLNNMTTFALYKSTCVVNFININASASSDEFLQKTIIWTLLQTICKLPNLTEIFIEDINLVCVRNRAGATAPEHVRICLPCTVRLVNLNRVRMTEETWRQLRKDITGIKHKVKFEAIKILPCCTYLVTLQSCV
ncbi:hypothetical protein DPMN_124027 [Dreissena polymorpha]|uniref:Uncharacterized protein n=1 Tax=Dreissena polymorpha TaxID=45954 RepID=A0A9D4GUW8_DREPO|nr:hypothetical protein DPMN_124027 [Dreissena polymorpha]